MLSVHRHIGNPSLCVFTNLFFSLGERIKDPWERDTLTINALQALGRWKSASVKLLRMIEVSPDSWDIITAYINGQLEMSLELRRETRQDTTKDSSSLESQAKKPEGESSDNEKWLAPLIEARNLLDRLAVAEIKRFENKEVCVRGPLLGRLELAKVIHQAKEKINIPLGI